MVLKLLYLGFINMTVKKIVKLFCFNILFLTMVGCGQDFSVGGASLEGTGNGLPPSPGLGNANDSNSDDVFKQDQYTLRLSGAATDLCGLVVREIQFLDLNQKTDLRKDKSYDRKVDKDKGIPIEIKLSFLNNYSDKVILEYPDCNVPLDFYNTETKDQLFPEMQCSIIKKVELMPDEERIFQLKYKLFEPVKGVWQLNNQVKITIPSEPEEECGELQLPLELIENKNFS